MTKLSASVVPLYVRITYSPTVPKESMTLIVFVSSKFLSVKVLLPILKTASVPSSVTVRLAPVIVPDISCKVLVVLKPVIISLPPLYWKITLAPLFSIESAPEPPPSTTKLPLLTIESAPAPPPIVTLSETLKISSLPAPPSIKTSPLLLTIESLLAPAFIVTLAPLFVIVSSFSLPTSETPLSVLLILLFSSTSITVAIKKSLLPLYIKFLAILTYFIVVLNLTY